MSLGALKAVQAQLSWTGTHILQRSCSLEPWATGQSRSLHGSGGSSWTDSVKAETQFWGRRWTLNKQSHKCLFN